MNKVRKMIAVALVVLSVFSVSAVAFASSYTFNNKLIYGGPSQNIVTLRRERSINIEQRVDKVRMNGQSGWKLRGYSNGQACTAVTTIGGTGNWLANFISYPTYVAFYESIASSSSAAYLSFDGTVYA